MEFSLSEAVRKIRGINPPFLTERQRALARMGGTLTKDERQAAAKNAYQTVNIFAPKTLKEQGQAHPEFSPIVTRGRAKTNLSPTKQS